jgi:hypothetical protein
VIGIGLDGQFVPVPPCEEHSAPLSSAVVTQLGNFVDARILNAAKIEPR